MFVIGVYVDDIELHSFLGIETGDVWIGQQAYVDSVLLRFGLQDSKPVSTPVDTSSKTTDTDECVGKTTYQSALGSLLYVSTGTRPDITYAVSNVAKYCSNPSKQHWTAVKRIIRYLKKTKHYGLLYSRSKSKKCLDSDYAGDLDDRKSTSGYLFKLAGAAISKNQ